jgi:hypothetical protein
MLQRSYARGRENGYRHAKLMQVFMTGWRNVHCFTYTLRPTFPSRRRHNLAAAPNWFLEVVGAEAEGRQIRERALLPVLLHKIEILLSFH